MNRRIEDIEEIAVATRSRVAEVEKRLRSAEFELDSARRHAEDLTIRIRILSWTLAVVVVGLALNWFSR